MAFFIFVLCAIGGGLFGYGVYLLIKKPGADRSDDEQE